MPRDTGYRLDPDDVLKAYMLGYFPMGRSRRDSGVVWVLPDKRGVLDLARARLPRRLRDTVKAAPFEIAINRDFAGVVAGCAAAAPGREDTWINEAIEEAYLELHVRGAAHSLECWQAGELVGGVYGVAVGAAFCGESMFSRRRDASKVAMAHLIARLKINGFRLLDTQFWTAHLAQFGVEEIPDARYQELLGDLLGAPADFTAGPSYFDATTVLQSITQTS